MDTPPRYLVFAGPRRVGAGSLEEILPVLKQRFDGDPTEQVLAFDAETGEQVDFDLRGSLADVLARATPPPRGPGRPRLGVISREVSLLPRHWDWLEEQPSGISAAIRRLVEAAMKAAPQRERARRIREGLSRFLSAMAGDRPQFEEATRALFAGDLTRFEELVSRWPRDIREHAVERAREAARAEDAAPALAPTR
ncbi:MAG TPA: DUF2239 family protein [Anaeromyxobacter sp.]|nr:DUF2239 family protein [Anaeromyxobacter sp.]